MKYDCVGCSKFGACFQITSEGLCFSLEMTFLIFIKRLLQIVIRSALILFSLKMWFNLFLPEVPLTLQEASISWVAHTLCVRQSIRKFPEFDRDYLFRLQNYKFSNGNYPSSFWSCSYTVHKGRKPNQTSKPHKQK